MLLREEHVPGTPSLEMKKLQAIFRHKVFKMLLAKGRNTRDLIAMLSTEFRGHFDVAAKMDIDFA